MHWYDSMIAALLLWGLGASWVAFAGNRAADHLEKRLRDVMRDRAHDQERIEMRSDAIRRLEAKLSDAKRDAEIEGALRAWSTSALDRPDASTKSET